MDKEDVVHIHTLKYYSARRKNKTMPFAAPLMDLEIILLSQTENDKYVSLLNLKKKWYKGIHLQNRNRLTDTENKFMVTEGEEGGGIN